MSESSQLSNLKLSSQKLFFSLETQAAELTLMNTHQNLHIYFKIKTKIEKVFEVKPSLGVIKPGDKQVVTFKPIKKLEAEEIKKMEENLQFLLKAVNSNNGNLKKEEEEKLWKQIKEKHQHLDMGYCSVKLNVSFTEQQEQQKEYVPLFNKFDSKVESKYSSQVKVSKGPKSISNLSDSRSSNQNLSDNQLSKKYEQLKLQEQKLIKQREKMFQIPSSFSGKKKSSSVIMIMVFLVGFLLGNFFKGVFSVEQIKPKKEKGFFDWS